ncbi:MAG: hypothetical protein ABIH83_03240, partial [Candidatus Micrarchaeota archaeon]
MSKLNMFNSGIAYTDKRNKFISLNKGKPSPGKYASALSAVDINVLRKIIAHDMKNLFSQSIGPICELAKTDLEQSCKIASLAGKIEGLDSIASQAS